MERAERFYGLARVTGGAVSVVNAPVAFDGSGNPRWSVAGDEPQMAIEGGGVIGKPGIVYDASPAKAND